MLFCLPLTFIILAKTAVKTNVFLYVLHKEVSLHLSEQPELMEQMLRLNIPVTGALADQLNT